jgi:hydrogenase maturation factor
MSVWIGAGPRPSGGRADHVLWVDGVDMGVASRTGELVLRYHLLWELVHVVFEHPGLLTEPASCDSGAGHCVTCSDEGRVVEVEGAPNAAGAALVLAAGRHETVDVSLIDDPRPGDLLLVHAGVALIRIAEER